MTAAADLWRAALVETDLLSRLRADTAEAHARLESALDLPRRARDRAWLIRLLELFHGFHIVWEPAVARQLDAGFAFDDRRRLKRLEEDLARLGRDASALARLPQCLAAKALAGSRSAALGSLYVMEGSTLGGQLIARALSGQPWLPAGGIGYFQPHGARTGLMWRRLGEALRTGAAGHDQDLVVAAAQRTFAVLQDWLAPAGEEAA